MRARSLALALALSACASGGAGRVPVAVAPAPAGPAPAEFKPAGEVQLVAMGTALASSSAAFDAWRVTGPRVNVARVDASTWGGHVGSQDLRVQVRAGRIGGTGMNVAVEHAGEVLEIGGLFGEARVRFELSARRIRGSVGSRSYELVATAPGRYVGSGRILLLTGAAADLAHPPMPQLALALIAASTE
jgi:hypothetical protein